jgi:triosephosphate isomerase
MSLPDSGARVLAPVVVGVSLKMYFDRARTLEWSREVAAIAAEHEAVRSGLVDLVVLPGFTTLVEVAAVLEPTSARLGAQDLFWEDRGAYTGEVSGSDLAELGCTFAEIGHAERRSVLGETDDMVADKVAAAVRNSLTPLLCVGELTEGSPEDAATECIAQLRASLSRVEGDVPSLVLAYEPVWAIGAAAAASPTHISAVSALVREWLDAQPSIASSRVIYGGSAGPGLLGRLGPSIDGLFLGRFAHDANALATVLDEALALQQSR